VASELHQATPQELKARIEARRRPWPFVLYRDGDGEQKIVELRESRLSIGRQDASELAVPWDHAVSRVHALLERLGDEWTLVDEGSSRNGTWLNGDRLSGRRRLRDGDVIRVGKTTLSFNAPGPSDSVPTLTEDGGPAATVSEAQRRVLVALCRPYAAGPFAVPASNQQIADELVLGVETVKTHLRALFDAFDLGDVPQHQKRAQLAAEALRAGVVAPAQLR
jgi:pSer/pThr/pTyr-binding forkhead associated (FHA) protein